MTTTTIALDAPLLAITAATGGPVRMAMCFGPFAGDDLPAELVLD